MRPMRATAVRTRNLTKRYGERAAVDGLDMTLPSGAITGFVGPNGAGKTTTIRMLLGLIRPTEGDGEVLGRPLVEAAEYLPQVGAMIEGPAFYPTLTGRRNLEVLARLGGIGPAKIDEVLELVDLSDRADDPYRSYSLGMKQRLGIAAALLPDPALLILDEPTNGLDPAGIRDTRALLRRLSDGGMTVVVSSHLLSEIQQMSDHLVMIQRGALVFEGGVEELIDRQPTEVVARPEFPDDVPALVLLCERAGYRVEARDGSVRVTAPTSWSPELNRRAMAAQITLASLSIEQVSLEEAFLAITEPTNGLRTAREVRS